MTHLGVLPGFCPSPYIALRILFCAHAQSARYSRASKPTDSMSAGKRNFIIIRISEPQSPFTEVPSYPATEILTVQYCTSQSAIWTWRTFNRIEHER